MRTEELTAKILKDNPNLDNYQIAVAVAQRCDELENGAVSKLNIDPKSVKSTDLALMEIAQGLVVIKGFVENTK
jgi:DNA-directed RNA polymerase subunit omega